jgi:hydroxymethylpyrimidine pyrophosphatase-like HAD family hydrolase
MRHYYLNDENAVARLITEFEKYGMIWVAYDFDNTVYDYHNQGHDYSEVIELLRALRKAGMGLIVFTAEKDTSKVKAFLDKHEIPYDLINENPPFFRSDSESRKIYFNVLLDDRAGLRSAFLQCHALLEYVTHTGTNAKN